ncbi:hypothetical protein [Nonomuraea terrae]|uniref:hypothetical protein n=1 Tax=Nonomuraea terrae TaxID=2530383 RepID=UPI00140516A5|nr:hypothetical protein [Nonomuraea terrae]
MTQDENLHVLVPIAHTQQKQRSECVGDGEVGQAEKHGRSSCRTWFHLLGGRSSRRHAKPWQRRDLRGWNYRQAQGSSPFDMPTLRFGVSHTRPVLPDLLDFVARIGFPAEHVTTLDVP